VSERISKYENHGLCRRQALLYTRFMARSKVTEELRQIDAAAIAAITPAERLDLAFELGRRGVEMYMTAHHVDYATAARELKRAGRAGRRYSRCMDDLPAS
jgi:hypothetical protein